MDYLNHYDSPIGGIDKKSALLELEGADKSGLYSPKKGSHYSFSIRSGFSF